MSDLQMIKDKILEEHKLQDIYEAMNCEYISFSGGRIEARLPEKFESTNKRAVQTRLNKYLTSSIRTPVGFEGGDIFSLVSFLINGKKSKEEFRKDLHNAKSFICRTLGWTSFLKGGKITTKKDYVAPLKALLKENKPSVEIKVNHVLPETTLDEFIPYPYYSWIEEGVSYNTQNIYGIGFDLDSHRVTIPLRNRFGKLVGVKGRIMKDSDDPEKKYLYIYRCQNRYEWFNFHIAHKYILQENRVYIFEAEKSCMKAFEHGIYNTLAIGSSEISNEQVEIIKQLGLDIEIVLCYDKGISPKEIMKQAERFKDRNVFGMFDDEDILTGKDSPIDEGIGKWNYLVENNIYSIKIK